MSEANGVEMEVLYMWSEGELQHASLPKWPVARPQLASLQERIERPELRQAYAWYINWLQKEADKLPTPACTWCGLPTGMFCDFCIERPSRAVCSGCCDKLGDDICRLCGNACDELHNCVLTHKDRLLGTMG